MFCILCALAIAEIRCEYTPFLIRRMRRPGGRQEVTAASTAAVPDPVKRMGTKLPPGANARMSLSRMPSIKSLNSDSRWQMSGFSNACRTRSDTLTGPGVNKIMTRGLPLAWEGARRCPSRTHCGLPKSLGDGCRLDRHPTHVLRQRRAVHEQKTRTAFTTTRHRVVPSKLAS